MKKFFVFYLGCNLLFLHTSLAQEIEKVVDSNTPSIETIDVRDTQESTDGMSAKADNIIDQQEALSEKECEKDVKTPSNKTDDLKNEEQKEVFTEPKKDDHEKLQESLTIKKDTIRLNEVLPNPSGTDAGNEFIEIYNDSDSNVSLENWRLYDKTEKYYIFADVEIESHSFITLYNKKDFSFALNNSDETITLEDADENIISEFSYEQSTDGLSWNYAESWYLEDPTPNTHNKEDPLTKEYPEILINEIFPNPKDEETKNEFIELYNPTDEIVSLKNWTLKDASQSGTHLIDDISISAKNYVVFYRSDFSFALNNSGNETISLIAPNSKIMSSVSYDSSRENFSLNHADKWYWHKPTPGQKNQENPLTRTYPQLFLSEVLPNPIGNENTDEFIEIYNPNSSSVDLELWTLRDATATGSFTFTESLLIQPHSYYTVYRKDFLFALNNSNEQISLIGPNEKVMSSISYKSSRENISYNYEINTKKWRWSKYLTPNEKNIFNNLPQITKLDLEDAAYKGVYTEFEVQAKDIDNEELRVRWDFGDGHKSYKGKTRHKYEETDTFYGSVRIQDESEEITRDFTITVKKYPKYDIKITKIVPNPAGKDSGNEYIIIKNKSKEKINLKNWSIATGTTEKTIVNHPIYEDVFIRPGKTKMITKKYAAISLPNKAGVIEIRRPGGSVSHIKKYGDKNISIPDNASYEKIDDRWQWVVPVDLANQSDINTIIAHALENEKMFSQQILEQKIAQSAVYNKKQKVVTKNRSSKYYAHPLFEKINQFLHTTFLSFNHKIRNILEKDDALIASEIYSIQKNSNPCTSPHITLSKTYDLCK